MTPFEYQSVHYIMSYMDDNMLQTMLENGGDKD